VSHGTTGNLLSWRGWVWDPRPMMTASDVLEVLGRLEAVGLRVWVDGG
jgi:hypothetical protein